MSLLQLSLVLGITAVMGTAVVKMNAPELKRLSVQIEKERDDQASKPIKYLAGRSTWHRSNREFAELIGNN